MNERWPTRRYFSLTLLLIILVELLSFSGYWLDVIMNLRPLFFVLIITAVFLIGLFNLKLALGIASIELIIGSKGHLFSLLIDEMTISIRIGIFLACLLAWMVTRRPRVLLTEIKNVFQQYKILIFLFIVFFWSVLVARGNANPWTNIFFDFNGWLYFIYLFPFFNIYKNSTFLELKQFGAVLLAGVVATAGKTLFFLFVFSHRLPIMLDLYRWGRKTLWGEFTLLEDGGYRLFAPAQIFVLLAIFLVLFLYLDRSITNTGKKRLLLALILILFLATMIISLSRSFWLGLISGVVAALLIIQQQYHWKSSLLTIGQLLIITIASYALLTIIINFPFPKPAPYFDTSSLISQRLTTNEAAVSSRWSQLPVLINRLLEHPFGGLGWGTTITYQSADPRIKTIDNPSGQYTTYSFEWGYIDIILKIGTVGLVLYLIFILKIFQQLWIIIKKTDEPLSVNLSRGTFCGLAALLIVHFFSPYLNHPLGIGYLILIISSLTMLRTNLAASNR